MAAIAGVTEQHLFRVAFPSTYSTLGVEHGPRPHYASLQGGQVQENLSKHFVRCKWRQSSGKQGRKDATTTRTSASDNLELEENGQHYYEAKHE